jgi:hypothetical protein
MRLPILAIGFALLLGAPFAVSAQTAGQDMKGAGQDMKQAGKDTGDAAKHTGKATAKTTKKAAKKVKHTTHNAAVKVEEKTKDKQ